MEPGIAGDRRESTDVRCRCQQASESLPKDHPQFDRRSNERPLIARGLVVCSLALLEKAAQLQPYVSGGVDYSATARRARNVATICYRLLHFIIYNLYFSKCFT